MKFLIEWGVIALIAVVATCENSIGQEPPEKQAESLAVYTGDLEQGQLDTTEPVEVFEDSSSLKSYGVTETRGLDIEDVNFLKSYGVTETRGWDIEDVNFLKSFGLTVTRGLDIEEANVMHLNFRWNELDKFPTDIPANRGIFVTSDSGDFMMRFYGGIRMRTNLDDRSIPGVWTLDYASLPSGADDHVDHGNDFSMRGSRVGLDVSLLSKVAFRAEYDWRGSPDTLRRRHLYLRTKNWVIGTNWTAFNTINFLPLTLDYHADGGHVGARINQIKYSNGGDLKGGNAWKYQLSLEDHDPKIGIGLPDDVKAQVKNEYPNLAGHMALRGDWGEVRVAGLLAPNRVHINGAGTHDDLGWGVSLGAKLKLDGSNVLMGHVMGVSGQNSMIADFSPGSHDMVYNPASNRFENLTSVNAGLALVHHWSEEFSSTLAGGLADFDLPGYVDDQTFDKAYKGVVNLIWKPKGKLDGVTMGVEFESAVRTDMDQRSSHTNRVIFALFYDF